MKILGLSANHYHDAAAALVVDGKVVAATAEERLSLQKHDPNFPSLAIAACLREAGLRGAELDLVAFHEVPEVKLTRALSATLRDYPRSASSFVRSMREAVNSAFWLRKRIAEEAGVDPARTTFAPHHLSHAALSFLGSPFEKAAVLTVDGVGEWMSGGIFKGDRGSRLPLAPRHVVPFPDSLGFAYAAFTGYLGFKVNNAECSTMALAAFGRPRYLSEVRDVIRPHEDGTYRLDMSYFSFAHPNELPVTDKFRGVFGGARPFKEELPFDSLGQRGVPVSEDAQRYADIACSVQQVVEEELLRLGRKARELTGEGRLCFSGGVALNCVASARLIASGIFDDVFIPADPGDAGGAAGAALYASLLTDPAAHALPAVLGPHLGSRIDPAPLLGVLAGAGERGRWNVTHCADDAELQRRCARLLRDGRILGWAQGRAENGPRALGNRSILIRPDDAALARRLSASVKKRASFRPYALSLAEEDAETVLGPGARAVRAYRWMQASAPVSESTRPRLRGALHADGTTRPQVCGATDNTLFHGLLRAYGELDGLSALLNTSFNHSGFPLADTSLDALAMFLRTDMDALAVGGCLLEKKRS